MIDNRPITVRLKERGFTVTNRTGKSLGVKMIVDNNGNDVGFLTPLESLNLIK